MKPADSDALAAARARFVEEAAAKAAAEAAASFDQDMALAAKLALKYPGLVNMGAVMPAASTPKEVSAAPAVAPSLLSSKPISWLIETFQTAPNSPLHSTRHATKVGYKQLMKKINDTCGDRRLSELNSA